MCKPVGDWISAPSPNFVTMATRVGPTKFCMVHLNWHYRKTPGRPKHLRSICRTSRLIQAGPKKVSQRNLHITSSNTSRFSKFIHCNILQEICNNTVIKYPTSPYSFTVTFSRKFAITQSLNIPPHLSPLPCEIFTS